MLNHDLSDHDLSLTDSGSFHIVVIMVAVSYKLSSIFQSMLRYQRSGRIYQLVFFESKSHSKSCDTLLLKVSDTSTDKILLGVQPC